MHASVSDENGTGHPCAGFLGQRLGKGGQNERTGILLAIRDAVDAQLGVRDQSDLGLDRCHGGLGLGPSVTKALARGFVHHQNDDVGQALPFLFLPGRVRQCREKCRQPKAAQPPARKPPPERQPDKERSRHAQGRDYRPADQRGKDHRLNHWPSLSSRAGTCTWSDL